MDVATGAIRSERHERAGVLQEHFAEFAKTVADGYSRWQHRVGEVYVLSRLGREFMNSHICDLNDVSASARCASVLDMQLPSDHSVVELVFALLARSPPNMHKWIADPMFQALCDEIIPEVEVDRQALFDSIARLVDVLHAIAPQARREGRPAGALSGPRMARSLAARCTYGAQVRGRTMVRFVLLWRGWATQLMAAFAR